MYYHQSSVYHQRIFNDSANSTKAGNFLIIISWSGSIFSWHTLACTSIPLSNIIKCSDINFFKSSMNTFFSGFSIKSSQISGLSCSKLPSKKGTKLAIPPLTAAVWKKIKKVS